MGTKSVRFSTENSVGIVTFSTVDAVFRLEDGSPVTLEYHPYCGPSFFTRDEKIYFPDEEDPLWEQFYGWWSAKGKEIYSEK